MTDRRSRIRSWTLLGPVLGAAIAVFLTLSPSDAFVPLGSMDKAHQPYLTGALTGGLRGSARLVGRRARAVSVSVAAPAAADLAEAKKKVELLKWTVNTLASEGSSKAAEMKARLDQAMAALESLKQSGGAAPVASGAVAAGDTVAGMALADVTAAYLEEAKKRVALLTSVADDLLASKGAPHAAGMKARIDQARSELYTLQQNEAGSSKAVSAAPAAAAPALSAPLAAPAMAFGGEDDKPPATISEAQKKVELLTWATETLVIKGSPNAADMKAKLDKATAHLVALKQARQGGAPVPVAAATPAPVAAAPAAQPVGSASVAPAAPAPVYTPAASAPVTLPTDLNEAKKKVEMLKWAADRLASEGSPRAGEMAAKLNQARSALQVLRKAQDGVTLEDLKDAQKKVQLLSWTAGKLASEGSPQAAEMRMKLDQAVATYEMLKQVHANPPAPIPIRTVAFRNPVAVAPPAPAAVAPSPVIQAPAEEVEHVMTDEEDKAMKAKMSPLQRLNFELEGGALSAALMTAGIMSLWLANTDPHISKRWIMLWKTPIGPHIGHHALTVRAWINEGLMTFFFFNVGLELKRELTEGSLKSFKQALLPCIAALGGMVLPIAVYLAVNLTMKGGSMAGLTIPMATDIAFAMGIFGLFRRHMPETAEAFLLTLATVDDLGAIAVIAICFSGTLVPKFLVGAVVSLAAAYLYGKHGMKDSALPMAIPGFGLWYCMLRGGLTADIAGFLIGLCIPMASKTGSRIVDRINHRWHPVCGLIILPLFALANCAVPMGMSKAAAHSLAVPVGVGLGLVVGKPLGIFGLSWIAVKMGIAKLPDGMKKRHLAILGLLGSMGFTMCLFLIECSLVGDLGQTTKLFMMAASVAGAVLSAILMVRLPKRAGRKAAMAPFLAASVFALLQGVALARWSMGLNRWHL